MQWRRDVADFGPPRAYIRSTRIAQLNCCERSSRGTEQYAQLLADARTRKLHPSVMTVLMAYAYGKPSDTTTSEPMIPISEIEDAGQSLEIKLQRIRESLESR